MALEQSISLLEAITSAIPQWIMVVPYGGGSALFVNAAAQAEIRSDEEFSNELDRWIHRRMKTFGEDAGHHEEEFTLPYGRVERHLSATMYPIQWRQHKAVAFVITDVSREKSRLQKLEKVAYRDNLTKVYSRHYGMQVLDRLITDGTPFCICFADLDNLKRVNDDYGHMEGDNYIVSVARALEENCVGTVCRLGGDEFMLLEEGLSRDEGEIRMVKVRKALADWPEDPRHPYVRSISYGVVEAAPGNDLTASELLTIADERMYAFKRAHKKERK